jgi:crossover junction endodeoxyribonuclease RuvC
MKVLGIDPGSETLGWGVVEGAGLKYGLVAYGTIKSSAKERFSKRLLKAADGIEALIAEYKPEVLSIEEAFYAVNVNVALKLGQVRGVALLAAERARIEIAEYSPKLIKQTVVGYGGADKQQVQHMVRLLLRLAKIPEPYDAADALAVAITYFHHAGMAEKIKNAKSGKVEKWKREKV